MTKDVHIIAGVIPFALLSVSGLDIDIGSATLLPALSMITSAIAAPVPDWDTKPMHYAQGKKHLAKKVAQAKTKVVNKVTGGHRGKSHTLLVPAMIVGLAYFVDKSFSGSLLNVLQSLVVGFLSGWTLHIFADLFNGKGCPIFWPLLNKKVHVADFPSEGIGQWLWLCLFAIACYFIIL